VPFNAATLGTPRLTDQPNLTAAKATFSLGNRLYWAHTDTTAPTGSTLNVSTFSGGNVGASWVGSGFNTKWFNANNLTSAFFLKGRMYYTTATSNNLFYRYLTNDGSIVGCTQFTLPTTGMDWRTVRGMAWIDGKLVYGSTDGSLRTVAFDPSATPAVVGADTVVIAEATPEATWTSPTLFFATS
jgi:hypothetical protein